MKKIIFIKQINKKFNKNNLIIILKISIKVYLMPFRIIK